MSEGAGKTGEMLGETQDLNQIEMVHSVSASGAASEAPLNDGDATGSERYTTLAVHSSPGNRDVHGAIVANISSAELRGRQSVNITAKDYAIAFQDVSYSVTKMQPMNVMRGGNGTRRIDILREVSGYVPRGALTAVIGHSGAGKTSFMGLASGIPMSGDMTGTVAASSKHIAFVSQYPAMPGDETVFEYLRFCCAVSMNSEHSSVDGTENKPLISENSGGGGTYRQKSYPMICAEVEHTLRLLNLTKVRHQQIRFLSGGERKRCSIASQLVAKPDILFLDEPTSGLDTPAAVSLIQRLLAIIEDTGFQTTVIVSIHQPQRRICALFDWVLSFHLGRLIWQGSFADGIKSRNKLLFQIRDGYLKAGQPIPAESPYGRKVVELAELYSVSLQEGGEEEETAGDSALNRRNKSLVDTEPPNEVSVELLGQMIGALVSTSEGIAQNPADYLLETEYLGTTEQLTEHWNQQLRTEYKGNLDRDLTTFVNSPQSVKLSQARTDVLMEMFLFDSLHSLLLFLFQGWRAFVGLCWRTIRYYYRRWSIVVINFAVSIFAGVMLGLIYGELGVKQSDVQNRFGAIGFITIFIGIQSVSATGTFINIREIFIDERNHKLYGPIPFLFARALPDLLIMRVLPSIVFGMIVFDMIGMQDDTDIALEYVLTVSLLSCVTSLFVFMISAFSSDTYSAGMLSIFCNLLFLLYGGMFIQNKEEMPWIVEWPKFFSFYRHAYEILFVNEMGGLVFDITDATVTINGASVDTDGLDVKLTGEYFIGFFGFNKSNKGSDYGFLVGWLFGYFALGLFALQFLHRSKR